MLETATALALATAILVAIPGPNVALIIANTIRNGMRSGLYTVCGTTTGLAIQVACVMAGLSLLIEQAAQIVGWIKWLGVAYLIYLGIRSWNDSGAGDTHLDGGSFAGRTGFLQGMALASINPKTLMFNAAFLPQFAAPNASIDELSVLGFVYLSVLFAGDTLWALLATAARPALQRFEKISYRISGAFLIGAGISLAFSRLQR